MRSLVAIAEHGAITLAASHLGISQSALSRRMAQLQLDVGAPLLDRVGRGVVLTEAGLLVTEEASFLLQRYERLRATLRQRQALEEGVVRIGGGATAVAFLLPGAIGRFRSLHPGIVFHLKEAGSRDVEEAVLKEQLELGVVTLPTQKSEFCVSELATDKIMLVGAKEHPLTQRRQVQVSALQGQSIVGFEEGSAIRRLIDSALHEAQVDVHVVMELRSVAAILQMVETTGSLAFVSELAARTSTDGGAGSVAPIRVKGLRIERRLALISKLNRPLSAAAEGFSRALLGAAPGVFKERR